MRSHGNRYNYRARRQTGVRGAGQPAGGDHAGAVLSAIVARRDGGCDPGGAERRDR